MLSSLAPCETSDDTLDGGTGHDELRSDLRLQGDAPATAATTRSGNLFRNPASGQQYIFNWSTNGLTAGTYQLRIDLADGASRTVRVSLR